MNAYKKKVIQVVEQYKRMFPQDYDAVVQMLKDRESTQTKWGEIKGQEDEYVRRKAVEWPADLYMALRKILNEEEQKFLFGDESLRQSPKGFRWFMREYPELTTSYKP